MRVIDIGIPRTGTVYRENTIKGLYKRGHYITGDYKPANYFTKLKLRDTDFVFAFVRNPFDLLVSHYEFIKRDDVQQHHPDKEFKDFTFEEFLKTVSSREEGYPNKNDLFFQFNFRDIDLLCKYEDMDEDIEAVCRFTTCTYKKQKPLNKSKRGDYKAYYTEELRDIVEQTWGRDLLNFGYSFDGKQ